MTKQHKRIGFFLDDERVVEDVAHKFDYPEVDKWKVFTSPIDLLIQLSKGIVPVVISLDHDLQFWADLGDGREEVTGYDCLKNIIDYLDMTGVNASDIVWVFHSANVIGKQNMASYVHNYIQSVEGKRYGQYEVQT